MSVKETKKHKMYICKRKIDIKSVSLKLRHNKFYLCYVPFAAFRLTRITEQQKKMKRKNIYIEN